MTMNELIGVFCFFIFLSTYTGSLIVTLVLTCLAEHLANIEMVSRHVITLISQYLLIKIVVNLDYYIKIYTMLINKCHILWLITDSAY